MLISDTLLGTIDKVQISIDRLKEYEPPEGYYLAFSGGKDSICIYQLALMAKVKFDAHFSFTTVDPPELVKFIREEYPDVSIDKPEKSMWKLIANNTMPPTRVARYCCHYLKERGGEGRFSVVGVRADESARRKHRKMVDLCWSKNKRMLNPIIDWKDKDVWEFIRSNNFKYPKLYDEGYKRIGCIMCPMGDTKNMKRDRIKFPNYYKAYLLAFKKMLENNKKKGKECSWKTPEEVMDWWIKGEGFKKYQKEQLFETEIERYHYE